EQPALLQQSRAAFSGQLARARTLVRDADLPLPPLAEEQELRLAVARLQRGARFPQGPALPEQRVAPVRLSLLERLRDLPIRNAGDRRLPLRPLLLRSCRVGRRRQRLRRPHVPASRPRELLLHRRLPADHLPTRLTDSHRPRTRTRTRTPFVLGNGNGKRA